MRYRMEAYPYEPGAVRIVARDFVAIVPREVAARFDELARRARPRGSWQLKILLELARYGRVAAKAAHWVRGRAASYELHYQRSLDGLMERLGEQYVQYVPHRGRRAAYYELREGE